MTRQGRAGLASRHTHNLLLNRKEHPLQVQIHNLIPRILLIYLFEAVGPPRGPRVREQNIHVRRQLAYFRDESLYGRQFGAIRWNGIRSSRQIVLARERVEC